MPRPVNSGDGAAVGAGGAVVVVVVVEVVVVVGVGATVDVGFEAAVGASVKTQTTFKRSIGEMAVVFTGKGEIGSIKSASVVLEPFSNVISSKGTAGARSDNVSRFNIWIDP